MNSTSRKIIVAGGMAAVVLIGVVTFALRSHPVTPVAQTAQPPPPIAQVPPASAGADITPAPAAVAQTPAAPAAAAQTPAAPAAVAKTPAAPAAVAHNDSVATKSADTATPSAVEPKLAHNRHVAKARTSAVAADTSEKPPAETVASSVDQVKSADESTPPPAASSSPADEQKVGTSTELAASDSQITTDVKSQIAGDNPNIGVTTTHGVVALTGKLASQDAIDHVKDVAGKVKDVKSVDASALILASL
jgi:hyperosmotically inducible protein